MRSMTSIGPAKEPAARPKLRTTDPQINRLLEALEAKAPDRTWSLEAIRADFDAAMIGMPVADDVRVQRVLIEGLRAEWLTPKNQNQPEGATRVVLYFHGGAYVMGSLETIRPMASLFVSQTQTPFLTIDYRLAPEHVFPAAVEDGVLAYQYLMSSGVSPTQIVFGGDSAGGGLTLSVLLAIRDLHLPMPAGAFCISPWTDLSLSAPSIDTKSQIDPQCPRWMLERAAAGYLRDSDSRGPIASPKFADLHGLPPLLIQVGDAEALLDDASTLADSAREAGVSVTYECWSNMPHVWHKFAPRLPDAGRAIAAIDVWLRDLGSSPIGAAEGTRGPSTESITTARSTT